MHLQLANLSHRYDDHDVLSGLNLTLEAGDIGCLLGPSGCGKTTVLRCIAGFEAPAGGEILVGGQTLARPGFSCPPEKRRIGMVFQEAALLPHLSAVENVAFGLHQVPASERPQRAMHFLRVVGLEDRAQRYPHELSGGQQQRVALARALAPEPSLLLLDEPFANLDAGLRERLGAEVREILKQQGVTAVLVTHDQLEAFTFADTIGVMHEGRLLQWGSAHEIYHLPVDRHVADFVGRGVLLPATVLDYQRLRIAGIEVAAEVPAGFTPGDQAEILLRPDDVIEHEHGQTATVVQRAFLGPVIVYELQIHGGPKVLASLPAWHEQQEGDQLRIAIQPHHVVLFRSPEAP